MGKASSGKDAVKNALIKNHNFKELIITKSLKEAYKLIRDINPDNLLILSKGDNIFLR